MKKIKIMLMSVLVLAVVGGALAFKAKKFDVLYCSKDVTPPAIGQTILAKGNCILPIETSTTVNDPSLGFGSFYITLAPDGENCVFEDTDTCPAFYLSREGGN